MPRFVSRVLPSLPDTVKIVSRSHQYEVRAHPNIRTQGHGGFFKATVSACGKYKVKSRAGSEHCPMYRASGERMSEVACYDAEATGNAGKALEGDQVMRMLALVLTVIVITLLAPPVAYSAESGLYTMTPAGSAVIRLNTRTGAVSLCHSNDESWICEAMPDEHIDLQRETARLKEENETLRAEIIRLEKAVGRTRRQMSEKKQDHMRLAPSEETVDEMMAVLEKMVRRFQDMVDSLEKPTPQKQL